MEFRLRYSGELRPGWLKDKQQKHALRKKFHPQLRDLWDRICAAVNDREDRRWDPLKVPNSSGDVSVLERKGVFTFAPFVSQALGWNTIAELDILFLRPAEPGQLIRHGGDIDNRIKVLFDSLRMPQNFDEIPSGELPQASEDPFCLLLQDDALVTAYRVTTDRLLAPPSEHHVELTIRVNVKVTRASRFNSAVF